MKIRQDKIDKIDNPAGSYSYTIPIDASSSSKDTDWFNHCGGKHRAGSKDGCHLFSFFFKTVLICLIPPDLLRLNHSCCSDFVLSPLASGLRWASFGQA